VENPKESANLLAPTRAFSKAAGLKINTKSVVSQARNEQMETELRTSTPCSVAPKKQTCPEFVCLKLKVMMK
jgi:hypothetical protein